MADNPEALSANQWKEQLDLDRPCGAMSSGETCWLCDDFVAWNPVMYAYDLELFETRPGMMLLKYTSEPVTTGREASRLASWLLGHHPCIQGLIMTCSIGANSPVDQPPFPIHLRPPSSTSASRRFRSLNITKRANALLALRDLDAVVGLETLYIDIGEIDDNLAAQINALMERNCSTLKKSRNLRLESSSLPRHD
ncbi:hypothetical protein MTO96_040951 [Rhipicephalus appendiculatus]